MSVEHILVRQGHFVFPCLPALTEDAKTVMECSIGSVYSDSPRSLDSASLHEEPVIWQNVLEPIVLLSKDRKDHLYGFLCGPFVIKESLKNHRVWPEEMIEEAKRNPSSLKLLARTSLDHVFIRLFTRNELGVNSSLCSLLQSKMHDTQKDFESKLESFCQTEEAIESLSTLLHDKVCRVPMTAPLEWNQAVFLYAFSLQSNKTMEDALFNAFDPASYTTIVGIMDGHGGSFAVRMMGQWLPRLLQCRLSWLAQKGALSPSLVAAALQGAYQETDARWIQSLRAKRMPLQLAKKFRVGDKRSERDVVVEEDQGPPLTQEQMTFLCAQGACALTIVISHSFFVVANTGDCRALLVTRTRQNTDWTCDWLNDIHVASNKKEWARVSEMTRSRDPVPLRPSFYCLYPFTTLSQAYYDELFTVPNESLKKKEDQLAFLSNKTGVSVERLEKQVARVAGNLMVTRALGDVYLKVPDLSLSPFCHRVPYLTCDPETMVVERDPAREYFVIMGSDGIWDHIDREEVMHAIVEAFEAKTEAHVSIVQEVLENLLTYSGMSFEQINRMPCGPARRQVHDDMTLAVLYLNTVPECLCNARVKVLKSK